MPDGESGGEANKDDGGLDWLGGYTVLAAGPRKQERTIAIVSNV